MTGPIVTVTRKYEASPERVFDAWLDPVAVGRFLFATSEGEMERVEVDPRVGGTFQVDERRGGQLAQHFGTFLELDRPRLIKFKMATSADETPTTVSIEIESSGTGCRLTLTHAMDPQWADFADQTRRGWTMILDSLARVMV